MPNANTAREYAVLRRDGFLPAAQAIAEARAELLLQWAEGEDRVRFSWSPSPDFDVRGFYGYPEPLQSQLTDELRRNVESGRWEALDCLCEVRRECGEFHAGASLSWIVVGSTPLDAAYRRQVERELFGEASA